jgi:hypothetical protein
MQPECVVVIACVIVVAGYYGLFEYDNPMYTVQTTEKADQWAGWQSKTHEV